MDTERLQLLRHLNRAEETCRRQAAEIEALKGLADTSAHVLARTEEVINTTRQALLVLDFQFSPQGTPPEDALHHLRQQIRTIADRCRPLIANPHQTPYKK